MKPMYYQLRYIHVYLYKSKSTPFFSLPSLFRGVEYTKVKSKTILMNPLFLSSYSYSTSTTTTTATITPSTLSNSLISSSSSSSSSSLLLSSLNEDIITTCISSKRWKLKSKTPDNIENISWSTMINPTNTTDIHTKMSISTHGNTNNLQKYNDDSDPISIQNSQKLKEFFERKEFKEAEEFFESLIQQNQTNKYTYLTLLLGYHSHNMYTEAYKVYSEMDRLAIDIYNYDISDINIILEILVNQNDDNKVYQILKYLTTHHIATRMSYGVVIQQYITRKVYHRAKYFYRRMLRYQISDYSMNTTRIDDKDVQYIVRNKREDKRYKSAISTNNNTKFSPTTCSSSEVRSDTTIDNNSHTSRSDEKIDTNTSESTIYSLINGNNNNNNNNCGNLSEDCSTTTAATTINDNRVINSLDVLNVENTHNDDQMPYYIDKEISAVINNIILDLFVKSNDTYMAHDLLKKYIGNTDVNSYTYAIIMRGYINIEQYDIAYQIYQEMKNAGTHITCLKSASMILDILMKCQYYNEVEDLISEIHTYTWISYVPSSIYVTVIKCYMNEEKWVLAYHFYTIMKQLQIPTIYIKSGNVIIDLLLKLEYYNELEDYLHYLLRHNLYSIVTFSTLIKGYMRYQNYDKAIYYYQKIHELQVPYTDSIAITIIIHFLLDCHKHDDATTLLSTLVHTEYIQSIHYTLVIAAYMKYQNYDNAKDLYLQMSQAQLYVQESICGNIILHMLLMRKEYEEAENVFQYMVEHNIVSCNNYGIMIKEYTKNNMIVQASKKYHDMKHNSIDIDNIETATTIMHALLKHKEYSECEALLYELGDRHLADSVVYRMIIREYVYDKNYSDAYRIYKLMRHHDIRINCAITGNIILNMLFKNQEIPEAIHLYYYLYEHQLTNIKTYEIMFRAYVKLGRMREAKRMQDMIESMTIEKNHRKYR